MPTNFRIKAFSIHFAASVLIAAVVALLVFFVWFRYPYTALAGGLHLLWMLVAIDVVCGPLLTAVLANPTKTGRELKLDFSIVVALQLAALVYGLYTISLARPVHLAYETDRFVAVSAADVDIDNIAKAASTFQRFSWTGPLLVGTREAKDSNEVVESIKLSSAGLEPSARPGWWQEYALSRPKVQRRMRSLADLRQRSPAEIKLSIDRAIEKSGKGIDELFYLPLVSKKSLDEWVVLLDKNADIVGYAAADGFLE